MQIQKFHGSNTKEIMQQITEALGPDAIIITSRTLRNNQLEIVAGLLVEETETATQNEGEKISAETSRPQFSSTADLIRERVENLAAVKPSPRTIGSFDDQETDTTPGKADTPENDFPLSKDIKSILEDMSPKREEPKHDPNSLIDQARIFRELDQMRKVLQTQNDLIVWRDTVHKDPVKGESWELLCRAGFSPLFARKMVEKIPPQFNFEQAQDWIRTVLIKNIPSVEKGRDLVNTGGVFALVGPTGVGKTTTTAKIAARCVMKYGKESVGLVTTDSFRIGAQDQLRIYGKLLGVQVYTAQTLDELRTLRQTLQRKHLVIIDTVGMAQRDERIDKQTTMLKETDASRILLLNAAAQSETLDDVARHYKVGGLVGSIISKLDEAIRLGGVLDVAIRNKLPIHYLATGQQVPEDIYACNSNVLVKRALGSKASSVFDVTDQERGWIGALSHKTTVA